MKAMIFAAGLGTRLYPYTSDRPKALVEVSGKALLQLAIEKIAKYGYNELVINIHHFGDQIIDYLEKNRNFGLDIKVSDERDSLLDTGGAILKAAPLLEGVEPFLVYNVDVISNIDLKLFRAYHEERGGLATMVVRDRKTERYLLLDDTMRLSGWRNLKTGCERVSRQVKKYNLLAYSGIQMIDPAIFKLITETGRFPLIPLYLRLSPDYPIFGYNDPSSLWMDLGKPDQLLEAGKLDLGA
jgi:NDP-sugar pyrophosphorylase family protein